MMGAVQPFLSGAISKTVNMPEEATVEEIEQLHMDSWKLGLKAVAIYRDNCKVAQPLSMAKKAGASDDKAAKIDVLTTTPEVIAQGQIKPLPKIRPSKTFSFTVADCHGYLTVGEYLDGKPGEIFVSVAKMGSTLAGLMDSFARSVSYGLQHGVPLKVYVKGMINLSFAPAGITDDPDLRTATSLVDYIFKRMATTYLSFDDRLELGLASFEDMPKEQISLGVEEMIADSAPEQADVHLPGEPSINETPVSAQPAPQAVSSAQVSTHSTAPKSAATQAPMCFNCGNQTQRSGSCYVCTTCGSTTGCS